MKKSLFISLILLSGILLTACGNKENKDTETEDSTIPPVSEECKNAVEQYLAGANTDGEGDEVKVGDNITVDYIGRLADGTVFDTSIKSIAEACDIYNVDRDYTEGLSFQAGAGQMVKGFDNGVIGMKIGQTKTVQFGPEEGYGEYDKSKVETYSADVVGDMSQYEVGMYMQKSWYEYGVITKITDKEMVVDFNHGLAGKDLIFDITLKENVGSEPAMDEQSEIVENLTETSTEN